MSGQIKSRTRVAAFGEVYTAKKAGMGHVTSRSGYSSD